ncbi:M15 family metallopeptidase [Leptospira levettii]|uniref:M15 family metallopeptidase n=1 Tax=Leptospira levettii TaxID=2023178 RepID=UPI00223E7565|nr:M15 family metallopeptidase [Leptospira levettii]MCW7474866.1 M15 family metallopeptidase [Leptospira levettii]
MSLEVTQANNSIDLVTSRLQSFWKDLKKTIPEAELFETKRSNERQTYLYSLGRTRSGEIVTYATAGNSPHNHGLAFDIRNVNYTNREKDIRELLSKNSDIAWGMDFWRIDTKTKKKVKFPDPAHFQIKGWRSFVPGLNGKIILPIVAVIGISIYSLRGKRK